MTAKQTGQRKTQTGRVLSDAGDKTIVIRVERLQQHPVYKRVIRRTARFMAHDELNDAKIGDLVTVEESRPLSARKRWTLLKVVKRGESQEGAL